MNEPKSLKNGPCFLKLKANTTYLWCSCGKSKNQPFCDGSHKGTNYLPIEISFEEDGFYNLCGCKKTKNKPYCDGSHRD